MTSANEFLCQNDFQTYSPKSSKVSEKEEVSQKSYSPQKKAVPLVPLSEKICEKLEEIISPLVDLLPKIK